MILLCCCLVRSLAAEQQLERNGALEDFSGFVARDDSFFVHRAASCPDPAGDGVVLVGRGDLSSARLNLVFGSDEPRPPGACNPYVIGSELLADDDYVYWVAPQGLVRSSLAVVELAPLDPPAVELAPWEDSGPLVKLKPVVSPAKPVVSPVKPIGAAVLPVRRRVGGGAAVPAILPGPRPVPGPLPGPNPAPSPGAPLIDHTELVSSEVPAGESKVELAQSAEHVFLLVADSTHSYIYEVRKLDGATQMLHVILGKATQLQSDGIHVYWLAGGGLFRLWLGEGAPMTEELDVESDSIETYLVDAATDGGETTRRFLARGNVVSFVYEKSHGNSRESVMHIAGPEVTVVSLAAQDSVLVFVERSWDTSCSTCLPESPWRYRMVVMDRLLTDEVAALLGWSLPSRTVPDMQATADGLFWQVDNLLHVRGFCRDCVQNDRRERGDVNGDLAADLSDSQAMLSWLFVGGTTPDCPAAADVNFDGELDIADTSFALSYLFLGGLAPEGGFVSCLSVRGRIGRELTDGSDPNEPVLLR
jgi:hypothetical protein